MKDDVKDNIMESILTKHGYSREYREGETHHMPVAMYKRAAAEAYAIIEEAEEKAYKISADAKSEVEQMELQVADCKDELKALGEKNKKIRRDGKTPQRYFGGNKRGSSDFPGGVGKKIGDYRLTGQNRSYKTQE